MNGEIGYSTHPQTIPVKNGSYYYYSYFVTPKELNHYLHKAFIYISNLRVG